MPENTEIHGDQKNITVFGFSAPWVVALAAVILVGVIGLAYVLVIRDDGQTAAPQQVVVTQQEIYRAETEKIEERALSVADSTRSVTKQITTESSGDYSVLLPQPEDDTDVTVYAVEFKGLSAGIEVSVKVLPVPDLSEADVPTPHRSKAVQALLIEVSGVEEADSQAATLSFALSETQLGESDPSSVSMWRFNKLWEQLPTRYMGMVGDVHNFDAETPGFSLFVITKETGVFEEPVVSADTSQPAVEPTATPALQPTGTFTPVPTSTSTPEPTIEPTLAPTAVAPVPLPTSTPAPVPTPTSVPAPTPVPKAC